MIDTIQQTEWLVLPEEVENQFSTLAGAIGSTKRMLGRIVDEYMQNVPQGKHMAAYSLFADLYHRATGETVSPRTIRHWRHAAFVFSKHDLREFHSLSDSVLIEAVVLAEIANTTPRVICEWAVAKSCDNVPQMRAHWLPVTGTEYQTDPPFISGMLRYEKTLPQEKRAAFVELVNEFRRRFAELMN